jgi:hypothetical protein
MRSDRIPLFPPKDLKKTIKRKIKFEKMSKLMQRFCYVISIEVSIGLILR